MAAICRVKTGTNFMRILRAPGVLRLRTRWPGNGGAWVRLKDDVDCR